MARFQYVSLDAWNFGLHTDNAISVFDFVAVMAARAQGKSRHAGPLEPRACIEHMHGNDVGAGRALSSGKARKSMSMMFKSAVAAGLFAGLISGCSPEPPRDRALVGAHDNKAVDDKPTGTGTTSPYPVYARWAQAHKNEAGVWVDYRATNSPEGVRQVRAGTVTFGATDVPLSVEQLKEADLVQFPMVIGGIVPVFNLQEIEGGRLVLDGVALARIFGGEIKSWDDEAIRKLNPALKLPRRQIVVVQRSDASGTTFVFNTYLSKHHPAWKERIGVRAAGTVGIEAKGNEGVAQAVMRTKGGIGFVQLAHAVQHRLPQAHLVNRDGKKVEASVASFEAAAAKGNWQEAPGFVIDLTDQPGAKAWPITSASYILVPRKPASPSAARAALSFFDWAYGKGGQLARETDFLLVPADVIETVRKEWTEVATAEQK